jgi:hypothetical protein
MPRVLVVVMFQLCAVSAVAQQRDSSHLDTSKVKIDLGNWREGVRPNTPPGVVFYFDYTKFFEWLLPKKKPLIPPDCDPKNMHEWMQPDTTKPDTSKFRMPV